jgi:uncharacterized membrane protein YeiH
MASLCRGGADCVRPQYVAMQPSPAAVSTALTVVEGAATCAFAIAGVIAAARKRLDPVGVVVVAAVTAFGGGTLRDVLLNRRPFYWVEHVGWLWALLALCALAMLLLRPRHLTITGRALLWPDAIGLGLFTANGTQIALQQGMPALVCAVMGVITAVFGSVIRDVVCNEVPTVFSDHLPYAICAFVGAWVLLGADAFGVPGWLALLAAAATTAGLRIAAMLTGFTIPSWKA